VKIQGPAIQTYNKCVSGARIHYTSINPCALF